MPYMPPLLVPLPHAPIRRGLMRTGWRTSYGEPAQADVVQLPQEIDIAAIEQYAPTIAKLIAGLTPEESLEVLKVRSANLQPYVNTPVIGVLVRSKIGEYDARIKVLERQAIEDQLYRVLKVMGVGAISITLASIAFYFVTKGIREVKETR